MYLEIIIVASQEYANPLRLFKAEDIRENVSIELVFVEELSGTADCLRAVHDRIRGEFICMSADFISQYSFAKLINLHKISASDITMLLAPIPFEEAEKKGGPKNIVIDEEDQEYIGVSPDGRVLLKTSMLDLDNSFRLSKHLLDRSPSLVVRTDLLDMGVYVMSKWILELLRDKPKFSSVRMDLIPYLIERQFQPRSYLEKNLPSLIHRKRYLDAIEPWLISQTQTGSRRQDLVTVLAKSILNAQDDAAETPSNAEDLLRCFSLVQESSPVPSIIHRLMNIHSYMHLNK